MKKSFWKRVFRGRRQKSYSAWQIELTTRCPLRCKMCCREGHHGMARKDMLLEDFQKILPYLRDVEAVVLEGWGESLLHPRLTEIIRLVKREGTQVGFVTSGLPLTDDYVSELVQAGTDFIGFSLSGATPETHDSIRINSHLPKLLDHIRRFQEIKARQNTAFPRLHIVYLLLKNNIAELPILIRLAKDLGIDEIILIHLAFVSNDWQEEQRIFAREGMEEYEKILAEAEEDGPGPENHPPAPFAGSPGCGGLFRKPPAESLHLRERKRLAVRLSEASRPPSLFADLSRGRIPHRESRIREYFSETLPRNLAKPAV